jgi:hypothetical protein
MAQVIRYFTGSIYGTSTTLYTAAANKVAKVIVTKFNTYYGGSLGDTVAMLLSAGAWGLNGRIGAQSFGAPIGQYQTLLMENNGNYTPQVVTTTFYTKQLYVSDSGGGTQYSCIVIEEDCAN